MKLYIDANGVYVSTQVEAKRNGKGWHQVDVPTTDGRQALADYLNAVRWSEQNIGGGTNFRRTAEIDGESILVVDEVAPVTPKQFDAAMSYSAQSINLDEQWEKLPLARKLHFAALAMEDVRAQL